MRSETTLNRRADVRTELERQTAEFLARGGRIQVSAPLGSGGQWPVPKSAPSSPTAAGSHSSKAKKLDGRIRWTPEREQLLRTRFEAGESLDDIGEALGVSGSVIKAKAAELSLRRTVASPGVAAADPNKRPYQKWTPERAQYLKDNYATAEPEALAAELGISRKSLYVKAGLMGLKRRDA